MLTIVKGILIIGWRYSQRLSTRAMPLERSLGFILIFTGDTRTHRQLLCTGYREKV
jgi:hypothetical protein